MSYWKISCLIKLHVETSQRVSELVVPEKIVAEREKKKRRQCGCVCVFLPRERETIWMAFKTTWAPEGVKDSVYSWVTLATKALSGNSSIIHWHLGLDSSYRNREFGKDLRLAESGPWRSILNTCLVISVCQALL